MIKDYIDFDCYARGILEVIIPSDKVENPYLVRKLIESKLPLCLIDQISEIVKLDFRIEGYYLTSSFVELGIEEKLKNIIDDFLMPAFVKVESLFNGITDCCDVIMRKAPSLVASIHFVNRYFVYALCDKMEQKFKQQSALLLCSLLPLTEPPNGDLFEAGVYPDGSTYNAELPGVLLGGWIRRYFRNENYPIYDRVKFALSLQNCKRAAEPISDRLQNKARFEHQKSLLGKDYPGDPNGFLPEVCDSLGRLVGKYYKNMKEDEIPDWRTPSLSACYELPSGKMGAYGYFCNLCFEQELYERTSSSLLFSDDTKKEYSIRLGSQGFSLPLLQRHCRAVIERIGWDGKLLAKYQQILEPFKVRAVTCAEAIPYHFGRMIQKPLHKRLRDPQGPFRFIGKRHNVDDINEVYSGTRLYSEKFFYDSYLSDKKDWKHLMTFFVAGDYTKATDNMHPDLPKTFWTQMALQTELSKFWIQILKLTLGPHIIDYRDDDINVYHSWAKKLDMPFYEVLVQKYGQLMGSPTSFPVLCLVNAAMLWTSVNEYYGYPVSWDFVLTNFRPLINGDDISFISNPIHYAIWSEVCKAAGLSLSPGKNYCTENFVNINSTTYWATQREAETDYSVIYHRFEQMFVLNSGLVRGRSKVLSEKEKIDDWKKTGLMPLCDQLDECLESANPTEKEHTLRIFFKHCSEKLKASQRSWTLPRQFGGLGLPREVFPDSKPSLSELYLALKQFDQYRNLSDLPIKYEFNDIAESYFETLWGNINLYFDQKLPIVKAKCCQQGEGLEVKELPSLAPYVLKPGVVIDKMYLPRRKGDKRTGTKGLKRKWAEYDYSKLKRKVNKKMKFFFTDISQVPMELYNTVFQNCEFQKQGTINIDVSIDVAEPHSYLSDDGVRDFQVEPNRFSHKLGEFQKEH